MCGRTACTLARDDILKACSFQDRKGKRRRPAWKDAPGGQQYKTSYNMAPGSFSPVLVSSKHFSDVVAGQPEVDHVVMPMKWGLVPRWHKDSPTKVSFKTSNCRGESMLEKATFKIPLEQGRRCVAVMDGFYEWKTTPSGKQPYFFQFTPRDLKLNNIKMTKDENSRVEIESPSKPKLEDHSFTFTPMETNLKQDTKDITVEPLTDYNKEMALQSLSRERSEDTDKISMSVLKQETNIGHVDGSQAENIISKAAISGYHLSSGSETQGEGSESEVYHKLLRCAAVYDVWQPPNATTPLYSYSMITVAASKDMSWCHHRMPAVLSTDQEVCDWLDFSTIPLTKANDLIHPKSDCLMSHPVSKNVNNSHYQSQDCLKPIDLNEQKKKLSGSGQMMMNWLKRGQSSCTDMNGSPSKAAKL